MRRAAPLRDHPRRLATEAGAPVWVAAGLAALVLLSGACSTGFDPYGEGPPYFAIDGHLDTRDDTLFVRVQDFAVPPGADPAPLAATVTLEDVTAGGSASLRDSLTLLSNGTVGHLFWTTASFQGGRAYRLRAAREGEPEATSEALFQVAAPIVTPVPGTMPSTPTRPLLLNGELARLEPVIVTYRVRRSDTGQTATVTSRQSLINATNEIRVSLSTDAASIRLALDLPENDTDRAVVTEATVTYLAVSEAPIRVEDGRGQVSWTARLVAPWRIPEPALLGPDVRLQDGQGG